MGKINKNRTKNLCNIPVLTKSGAGAVSARHKQKAPPKGCPHKKGGNQILKIDRVGGESNPTESSTLVGQSTA